MISISWLYQDTKFWSFMAITIHHEKVVRQHYLQQRKSSFLKSCFLLRMISRKVWIVWYVLLWVGNWNWDEGRIDETFSKTLCFSQMFEGCIKTTDISRHLSNMAQIWLSIQFCPGQDVNSKLQQRYWLRRDYRCLEYPIGSNRTHPCFNTTPYKTNLQ